MSEDKNILNKHGSTENKGESSFRSTNEVSKSSNEKKSNFLEKLYKDNPNLKEMDFDYNFDDFYELLASANVESNVGHKMKAVFLFLAAYFSFDKSDKTQKRDAVFALKETWKIVVSLKLRPLAEYVFELIKDDLSDEELSEFSKQLNHLMFDKLKDIGIKPEKILSTIEEGFDQKGDSSSHQSGNNSIMGTDELLEKLKRIVSTSNENVPNSNNLADNKDNSLPLNENSDKKSHHNNFPIKPDSGVMLMKKEVLKYKDLVGFDRAVNYMRERGLDSNSNNDYKKFVQLLNKQHGLDRVAFNDTVIFRSADRSDAKQFMEATAGEIGMPCMVMHMDENIQGASVLSMVAPANANFRLNPARTGFNGKGIIILEDIDTWNFPELNIQDIENDMDAMLAAQMSRGVLEVINLIEIALNDPNIIVMANVGTESKSIGPFSSRFNKYYIVDIDLPNKDERRKIWQRLAKDHPSLGALNIDKLTQLSNKMSRYSIEMAAHEAIEHVYKKGLEKREYIPLTLEDIIKKLADHQPLESFEYKTLEDEAAACFKQDLKNIDDLLK